MDNITYFDVIKTDDCGAYYAEKIENGKVYRNYVTFDSNVDFSGWHTMPNENKIKNEPTHAIFKRVWDWVQERIK